MAEALLGKIGCERYRGLQSSIFRTAWHKKGRTIFDR